ncbi:MAG: alpha-L-fucosidase [bacterium]
MMEKKNLFLYFVLFAAFIGLLLPTYAFDDPQNDSKQTTGKTALENFQDMKFGMFIHWGIYAVPAGEWKGEYVRGIGEWIMHRKQIPVKEYEKLAEQFNPVKFNADEWAQLAQDAGMKYMVITSKHHDGFAMYHSKVSDYNIVDRTPFKRDPMKELAAANAKRGIKFGFYYSQAQDWHEPNAAGNTWDFPEQRDPKPYVEGKALPQVEEILRNYGDLALIWFDTPRLLTQEQALSLKQKVKELQPNCLVNNRIGFNLGDYYQTGDNAIPTMVYDWKAWEIPATLNDTWGYKKDDQKWKDPHDLIYKLTDIVSKGGNYLLNVGPTAEGVIPEESQKILRTIGKWMKVNGEAIYATKHTPLFYPDLTWKCTAKLGKLYFHIVNWPGTQLEITGIESKVKQAYFLANKQKVKFEQKGNKLSFSLPAQPLDPYNTIVAVEISDEKAKITPGYGYRDAQKTINLYALDARMRGEEQRYHWKSQSVSGFFKAENPKNELWWYHHAFENGVYRVDLEYACDNDFAGSEFYFYNMKDEQNKFAGTIQATKGEFKVFGLMNVKLTGNEENRLIFGLADNDISAKMRVRRIILSKVENPANKE